MRGLRKNLLYAIKPCLLGLCGPSNREVKNIILEFLRGKKTIDEKTLIEYSVQFKNAPQILKTIAEANGIKNQFDEKVVEAYWLGNELLKKCPNAHHSYRVLFVGSPNIAPVEKLASKCIVNYGKMEKIGSKCLFVKTRPLEFENGKAKLGAEIIHKIEFDPDILPSITIGNTVSYHWDFACEVIDKQQAENLIDNLKRNIDSYNSVR